VQKRARGAVDGAHHILGQLNEVVAISGGVVIIVVDQTLPAFAHANRLKAFIDGPVDQAFETHIQAGHLAPAGQNGYSFACAHLKLLMKIGYYLQCDIQLIIRKTQI
jgi:hypothetical protein